MRALAVALGMCLCAAPAVAQQSMSVPGASVDTSQFPTASQVQSQIVTATAALASQSALVSVQNAIPGNCNAVPAPDTVMGSVSGTNCFTPAGATRSSRYQAQTVTTGSAGAFSGSWTRTFTSAQPVYEIPHLAGQYGICKLTTYTQSAFAGACQVQPINITVVGISVAGPLAVPAVNSPVMVTARESTQ